MTRLVLVAASLVMVIALAGCNLNKYDAYRSCSLEDGKYQLIVSVAHDSSEPTEPTTPVATYVKLCKQLVGRPDTDISKGSP